MKLLTGQTLHQLLEGVNGMLSRPVEIVLVGGVGVLLWYPEGTATRDLDAMRTADIDIFIGTAARWCERNGLPAYDINTRADPFEVFFPQDWREQARKPPAVPDGPLEVLVPRPEDLATSKVFRFMAKDAEDIRNLASLPGFDRSRFRDGFVDVLTVAIGNPREHAHCFSTVWNKLWPGEPIEAAELLRRAGIDE
jgi:hypothetical protein